MATSLTAPAPPTADPGPDAVPLSGYSRQIRRHRLALAVCLALGLIGAGGYLWWNHDNYHAVAQVLIRDPADIATNTGDRIGTTLSMDSEVQVLKSHEVAVLAAAGLGMSPRQVSARASVTIPPNSRLLRIEYRDGTRAGAIRGANEVALAYLHVRQGQYDQQRTRMIAGFNANIAAVSTMRNAATRVAKAPTQPLPAQLSAARRAGALQGQIDRMHYRISQLQEVDTTAGRVTEAATSATGPVLANQLVPIATGLALAVGGYVLLLPVLARRRRVRTVRDVARLPDVHLVIRVPRGRRRRRRRPGLDRATAARLWAQVLLAGPAGPRVVVLLPADDGVAAADVALGLATASAAQCVPASLVATGEPPWPALPMSVPAGLVATGEPPWAALPMSVPAGLVATGEPPWAALPGSGTGPAAGEPASGEAVQVIGPAADGVTMVRLCRPEGMSVRSAVEEGLFRLGRRYDLIVVLAPAPGAPEHQALARAATVPIIVAERGRTRLTDVERTAAQARAVGASPPWVLLSPRQPGARADGQPGNPPGRSRGTPPGGSPGSSPGSSPGGKE